MILLPRFYSSSKAPIDEINNPKKLFTFGGKIDPNDPAPSSSPSPFEAPQIDVSNHPKLQGLQPNSPEFKYQLHLIQQEVQANQEKDNARWEFRERIKGIAAGFFAVLGVISIYGLFRNYQYLKGVYHSNWTHVIDDSKVADLNDPKANRNRGDKLAEKLTSELDLGFLAGLQSLNDVPGLYVFGAANGKKLPTRILAFDGMFLRDVAFIGNVVVALAEDGNVFHYLPKSQLVKVKLPSKVDALTVSGESIYYVSKNKSEIYVGQIVDHAESSSGWISSGLDAPVKVIKGPFSRGEKISTLSAGDSHLVVLTNKGRLFETATRRTLANKGQFALPKYLPLADAQAVPVNELYELVQLNNEVVASGDSRSVEPRVFTSVAAGANFTLASDSRGNIWTWGDNTSGQCGKDLTYVTDVQPVPKLALSLDDLAQILKLPLGRSAVGHFSVSLVHAADTTAFVNVKFQNAAGPSQDLLLAFGNGLKGQLGISRYLHMNSRPVVVKSLVGLTEFDEDNSQVVNVGLKDVSVGGDHVFVTLNNAGSEKDVLVFGDNENGQFGNGKVVRSPKPVQIPKLIEPKDVTDVSGDARRHLARRVNDPTTARLQLKKLKIGKKEATQVIVARGSGSAIFYKL